VSDDELDTKSPPELARLWHCKPKTIIDLIEGGELKAFNLSSGRRPRWKIPRSAIIEFQEKRTPQPPQPLPQRKRSTKPTDVIEFF
jgi:hypothetical protein